MKKIRIAQIGINEYSHARDIFNTLKNMSDLYEVVGYVLVEDEREKFAHILSTYSGYKELTLEEVLYDKSIQAVTVETEEKHLTKYAKLAVASGKHVHVEKPGGVDLLEFQNLIETAKIQEKILHFGYMYRYNPAVLDLLKRIKDGDLGEIVSVEANMDCYHPFAVRSWLNDYKGGMTFFLGCHLIDLILQIQGVPKSVLPLNKNTLLGGETGEDFGLAVLEYERLKNVTLN